MYKTNETRLNYDSCSYAEKLKRTTGPGLYMLNIPYDDCNDCKTLPSDPALRFQTYGPNTCTMKKAVDDSSELLGLNYKQSKCNNDAYGPGKYNQSSGCIISNQSDPRKCINPKEDTRLSNPPSTLKETGINRWEWLCYDPQERAIEEFDRIPVNYRMVAKDNHAPIIETPDDVMKFFPDGKDIPSGIDQWQQNKTAQEHFAPGYPYGTLDYNIKCN